MTGRLLQVGRLLQSGREKREGSSPFDPLIRERELEGQESISSIAAAAAVFITTSILLFEPKDEKKGLVIVGYIVRYSFLFYCACHFKLTAS